MYITDRTSNDVERWLELRNKGWDNMTPDERQEWIGEISPTPSAAKGMYTHNDLNRVESAVANLVSAIKSVGYALPDMVIKTDWKYSDRIYKVDMDRYFDNVDILRSLFPVYPDTPETPTTDEKFNYEMANNVEKILSDVHSIFDNLKESWLYTGDTFSGEV